MKKRADALSRCEAIIARCPEPYRPRLRKWVRVRELIDEVRPNTILNSVKALESLCRFLHERADSCAWENAGYMEFAEFKKWLTKPKAEGGAGLNKRTAAAARIQVMHFYKWLHHGEKYERREVPTRLLPAHPEVGVLRTTRDETTKRKRPEEMLSRSEV